MRIPRVFVDTPLREHAEMELSPWAARHLVQVLRLNAESRVLLFDGSGRDFEARLARVEKTRVWVQLESAGAEEPVPPLQIHLALGLSKGDRFDYALQKAVELGVCSLTPLITERSVVRLEGARLEKRMEHWRGVITSACEQSGRRRIPVLTPVHELRDWLGQVPPATLTLDPRAEQALPRLPAPAHQDLTLLIGPEGGLSQKEHEAASNAGCTGVRLGPRILRTETAPVAAIAVIQALWGDFAR